jgi:hypothetical protein
MAMLDGRRTARQASGSGVLDFSMAKQLRHNIELSMGLESQDYPGYRPHAELVANMHPNSSSSTDDDDTMHNATYI